MRRALRSTFSLVLLALLAAMQLGCDLGRYETRRANAAQEIANRGTPITVADKAGASTGISLELPKVVGKTPAVATGLPGAFDGVVGVFEAQKDAGGPLVLYGGVPAAEGPVEKIHGLIPAAFQLLAPGVNPQVTDVSPTIKRFTFVGQQAFKIGEAVQNVPGKTDVVVITSATHIALLAYRVTDANDQQKQFDAAVNRSIGTIKGSAPLAAPAAAPAGANPMPMPNPMPMGP